MANFRRLRMQIIAGAISLPSLLAFQNCNGGFQGATLGNKGPSLPSPNPQPPQPNPTPIPPAPRLTVLSGLSKIQMNFNEWTFSPIMNAEVTPWAFNDGSANAWTGFLVSTNSSYQCATPDNIFSLSSLTKLSATNTCRLRLQSQLEEDINLTSDPTPWRFGYYGAQSGEVTNAGGSNYTLYSINHGEHSNIPANTFQNSSCISAPDIGYGTLDCNDPNNSWGSYNAFVSMSSMPWTSPNLSGNAFFTDLGPITWPSNGYVETIDGVTVKATDGGVRHPTSIVHDGYLYIFYEDMSQGDESAGTGPGMKVARAPVTGTGVDPRSFKTYYNGAFTDWALPSGFDSSRASDFYASKGGRSNIIFPDQTMVLQPAVPGTKRTDMRKEQQVPMFAVAKVSGTEWFLGVGLEVNKGVTLRLSKDLVHWSLPSIIPGTEIIDYWNQGADFEHLPLEYPRLMNAAGNNSSVIDANDFYIVGMTITDLGGTTQKTMQFIRLKLEL